MADTPKIEVYKWAIGTERSTEEAIALLAVPDGGQAPQVSDIIWLGDGFPWETLFPYRVLSRELLWGVQPKDFQEPIPWGKM